jgi:hypothetical protein
MATKTTAKLQDNSLFGDLLRYHEDSAIPDGGASVCQRAAEKVNALFARVSPKEALDVPMAQWEQLLKNVTLLNANMGCKGVDCTDLLKPTLVAIQRITKTEEKKPMAPVSAPKHKSTKTASQVLVEIQAKLKTLENRPEVLTAFLAEVRAARAQFPELRASLLPLKKALKKLLKPEIFKQELGESGVIGKKYQADHVLAIANMTKSDLVKILRKLDLTKDNTDIVKSEIEKLAFHAFKQRLGTVLPLVTDQFARNVKQILNARSRMKERLQGTMNLLIKSLNDRYDAQTAGRFSSVIGTYSYANLESRQEALLTNALKPYQRKLLALRDSLGENPSELGKKIATLESESAGSLEMDLMDSVSRSIQPFYVWLSENMKFLKKAYNQGDDGSRNLGDGTCFQNSLDRFAYLSKKPDLEAQHIQMGSTERGRFFQSLTRSDVSSELMIKKFTEALGRPFKPVAKPISTPAGTPVGQSIVSQLLKFSADKPLNGFLGWGAPGGHSMNVQIDHKLKIYRLIDDNVGILEYPTPELFAKHVGAYLSLQYPFVTGADYTSFEPLSS